MRRSSASVQSPSLRLGVRVVTVLVITAGVLLSGWGVAVAEPPVSEEAYRHYVRSLAAVETARSVADFTAAAREMEHAKRLAPQWPDIYYNLGLIYEKGTNYQGAIDNLRRYLELAPGAADAAQVREKIYRLEYLQERNDIAGIWKTDVSASQVACSPASYLVTDSTILSCVFLVDDLQLEVMGGPDGTRGRILSSKFRYGALLQDAPYAPISRAGELVMIDKAVMYTCSADVQPDLCPWEARFALRQVEENVLEGDFSAGGSGRNMDLMTQRKQADYFQCSGKIVLKRSARR